jgi:hypothetical protein
MVKMCHQLQVKLVKLRQAAPSSSVSKKEWELGWFIPGIVKVG